LSAKRAETLRLGRGSQKVDYCPFRTQGVSSRERKIVFAEMRFIERKSEATYGEE
jgi:hypothetical protein